jgi:hypothetical protein
VQCIDNTPRTIQTKHVPLRKELYEYLEVKGANDRDTGGSITTPDWNLENIEEKIESEALRYFSVFDLSLGPEFEFFMTTITLHDSMESLMSNGQPTTVLRRGTNLDEMARRFKSPKSYTSVQLKVYQKKLFGLLNKRVSFLNNNSI